MRLTTARDHFLQYRQFGSPGRRALGEKTLIRYKFALTTFIDWLVSTYSRPRHSADSVPMFSSEVAREYIAHRSAQDVAPSTLAVDCAVLREFAAWGVKKRYWQPDDVDEMPAVQRPDEAPRPMSDQQRDRVMALPLEGDELVLRALLYYTGAREFELLGLM